MTISRQLLAQHAGLCRIASSCVGLHSSGRQSSAGFDGGYTYYGVCLGGYCLRSREFLDIKFDHEGWLSKTIRLHM